MSDYDNDLDYTHSIISLNNSIEYVNGVIDNYFKGCDLNDELRKFLQDEFAIFEYVVGLFKFKDVETTNKLYDFVHMYHYMFKAFLISEKDLKQEYNNILHFIFSEFDVASDCPDSPEKDFCIWLVTEGFASGDFNADNARGFLLRLICGQYHLFDSIPIEKIYMIGKMSKNIHYDLLYDSAFGLYYENGLIDEETNLKKLKALINCTNYLVNIIYSDEFINNHVEPLDNEELENIAKEKAILQMKLDVFQEFVESLVKQGINDETVTLKIDIVFSEDDNSKNFTIKLIE